MANRLKIKSKKDGQGGYYKGTFQGMNFKVNSDACVTEYWTGHVQAVIDGEKFTIEMHSEDRKKDMLYSIQCLIETIIKGEDISFYEDGMYGGWDYDEEVTEDAVIEEPTQAEDVTYTATITKEIEDAATSTYTTTLPAEKFKDLTAEDIKTAIMAIMTTEQIAHMAITQWGSEGSKTIQFGVMPKLPEVAIQEPERPAHYGDIFGSRDGGPDVIVGHPSPFTGMIVQWPSHVPEDYQLQQMCNILDQSAAVDIRGLKKQLDGLEKGDRISFTWNNKVHICKFELVRHKWDDSNMNVREVEFLTGKKMRYQNNISVSKITNFEIIK